MHIQPSIFIGNIRIDEPVTTLTDVMVSLVCFYAFFKLKGEGKKGRLYFYLRFYFLSMGIATAIGGLIGHGFLYVFQAEWKLSEEYLHFVSKIFGDKILHEAANPWKLPGWLTSMFSIALVERATIEHAKNHIKPSYGKLFSYLNLIELALFVALTFSTLNFFFVEIHSFYGVMLVVGGFNLFGYLKTRKKGNKLFLIAVAFTAISALFFMNEWSLNVWFNHLDFSHTFMAIAAFFFYKGACFMLRDN